MKRTIYTLLLLIGTVVLTAACEKGKGDSISQTKLVKEIIHEDGTKEVFEYDGLNRLIKAGDTTYEYYDNTVIETSPYVTYISHFDNDGYCTKDVDDRGYNYREFNYIYDNGQIKLYNDGTSNYNEFVWENGDIIEIITEYPLNTPGPYIYKETYEYTDFEDKLNINLFGRYWTIKYKGTYSRHLPKSCSYNSNNSVYNRDSYSYEFDADGYVTKIITTSDDGTTTDRAIITYY